MAPFESPGLQNCIGKWAKLRHGPPLLCKLGIRLWARNHLILGEKQDEIWVKTFFFCFSPDFGRKNGTKFECDNFKFWSMFLSNFLKFQTPPFLNPAYATGPIVLLFLGLGHGYPQYQIGLPYYNRSNCSEPNSKLNPQLPHCQVRKDRNARKSLPSHDWNLKHLTKLPPEKSSRSGGWIFFMSTTTTGSLPSCQ